MQLLLDTQAFMWFANASPELSSRAKTLIETPGHDRYLSIATLWEMAIKSSIGKLSLPEKIDAFARRHLPANMLTLLPIEIADVATLADLPHHHRDPFDRIIVAQAMTRQMVLVSSDRHLDAYGVHRIW